MAKCTDVSNIMELGWDMMRLGVEAQAVMNLRMMGMAGLWAVKPSENDRMVSEKAPAFVRAQVAMTKAAMRGAGPEQIWRAGLRPLTRVASANRSRLLKGG